MPFSVVACKNPTNNFSHFCYLLRCFAISTFARLKKWAQDVNTTLVGQAVSQEYNLVRKVSCLSTIFLHFVFEGRQFVVL